jgi:hypothetical protein
VGTSGGPSYTKPDSAGHAKLEISDTTSPRITVLFTLHDEILNRV